MAALAMLLTGCYASHGARGSDRDGGFVHSERDAAPAVHFSVTDTTGWTLRMSYSSAPPNIVMAEPDLPYPIDCPAPQHAEGALDWHGRVLVTHARCDGRIYEIESRPVVCGSRADCQPVIEWLLRLWPDGYQVPARTECVDGLCQFPDQAINRQDVYSLCLASTPRWRDFQTARSDASGYPDLRALVAAHCIGECSVPDSCRQL